MPGGDAGDDDGHVAGVAGQAALEKLSGEKQKKNLLVRGGGNCDPGKSSPLLRRRFCRKRLRD